MGVHLVIRQQRGGEYHNAFAIAGDIAARGRAMNTSQHIITAVSARGLRSMNTAAEKLDDCHAAMMSGAPPQISLGARQSNACLVVEKRLAAALLAGLRGVDIYHVTLLLL